MVAGIAVALPANRMTGIYLAIATLAFSQIVEQIVVRWESVTRGFQGMPVPPPDILGHPLSQAWEFYYLCLAVLVAGGARRRQPHALAHGPRDGGDPRLGDLGAEPRRQPRALQDHRLRAVSACITGLAGALLGHKLKFISPDAFNILLSIQLLLMVVVGGLGSIHGAIYGAIFVGGLPQAIALMRDYLPGAIARTPGLEPGLFGLVMILIVLFEPHGDLRPLAEDQGLFRLLPALPAVDLQAPAILPQDGARAVSHADTTNVVIPGLVPGIQPSATAAEDAA